MKNTFTTLGLLLASLAFAQVTIDENIVIAPGSIFYSDLPITVNTGSTLSVNGSLEVHGEISGDEFITIGDLASIFLDEGTLTLNPLNEKFVNLTLGTTGIVEIPAGKTLTLTGDLANANTTSGLKLYASELGGYAQLITEGAVTGLGKVHAEQFYTATTNPGWRQFGSPVTATFAQLDDDFLIYYPAGPGPIGNAGQLNVRWWDAIESTTAAPAANGWTVIPDNTWGFGPSSFAVGHNIYVGGAFDVFNGGHLDVDGTVGNGNYNYRTQPTSTAVGQTLENIGWQLIPNPYPSNIDITALLSDGINFPLAYKAIHIWDGKNQQYLAISDDVNILFTGPTNASNLVKIAPFQAFWVKGGGTVTQTVTLTNTHRTLVAQGNFFKAAPALIRINAIAQNGALDQTIITFETEADDRLDDRDAFKIITMNEELHSLYTFADGNKIAINRKAMPEPDKHIPMQFVAPTAGEFKIDMVEETVSPAWMIELEDHKTGSIHNMRNGDYTFANEPDFKGTRFTVHINKSGESIDNPNKERVYIYGTSQSINVVFGYKTTATKANVLITNLAGQILFNGNVSTESPFAFPVNDNVAMYVVHVITDKEETREKVVVGN